MKQTIKLIRSDRRTISLEITPSGQVLVRAPRRMPEVPDYVVVHELSHRLEMNHSSRFWAQVENVIPDYRRPRKWLKEHGSQLMLRMHGIPDSE